MLVMLGLAVGAGGLLRWFEAEMGFWWLEERGGPPAEGGRRPADAPGMLVDGL